MPSREELAARKRRIQEEREKQLTAPLKDEGNAVDKTIEKIYKPKVTKPAKPSVPKPKKEPVIQAKKSISISLYEEDSIYCQIKAARTGKTKQQFIEDTLRAQVEKVKKDPKALSMDPSLKPFRRNLYDPIKMTVSIDANLIEEIKESALLIGMRINGFLAWSINKAMNEDKDWQGM